METRNFLFSRLTLLLAALLLLADCARTPARRQTVRSTENPLPRSASMPTPPGSAPISGPAPVGVYLGPGGIRSFAHIGVLRALQRAGVPIVAIGGMEWGALVASVYAFSQAANDVEWQLMKLKKNQFPGPSLLRRAITPGDPGELAAFLDLIFPHKSFEQSAVPFSCPVTDGRQVQFIERGPVNPELMKCVSLLPLYEPIAQGSRAYFSGVVAQPAWADILKRQGARYIIYVDVLSKGRSAELPYASQAYAQTLIAALKSASYQQRLQANYVIEVPSDIDISDFDRRREAMALGERAAQPHLSEILKNLGL